MTGKSYLHVDAMCPIKVSRLHVIELITMTSLHHRLLAGPLMILMTLTLRPVIASSSDSKSLGFSASPIASLSSSTPNIVPLSLEGQQQHNTIRPWIYLTLDTPVLVLPISGTVLFVGGTATITIVVRISSTVPQKISIAGGLPDIRSRNHHRGEGSSRDEMRNMCLKLTPSESYGFRVFNEDMVKNEVCFADTFPTQSRPPVVLTMSSIRNVPTSIGRRESREAIDEGRYRDESQLGAQHRRDEVEDLKQADIQKPLLQQQPQQQQPQRHLSEVQPHQLVSYERSQQENRQQDLQRSSAQQVPKIYDNKIKLRQMDALLVAGNKTGHFYLNIDIRNLTTITAASSSSSSSSLSSTSFPSLTYRVTVVEGVTFQRDVLFLVVCSAQLLALFALGLRVNVTLLSDVIRQPSGLMSSALIQALVLPLVGIGVGIALNGPVQSFVCHSIIATCPTGVLTPLVTVLQHGHVELSVVLLILQTATAVGTVPVWLFVYDKLFGDADDVVTSFQFWLLGGALLAVTGPILLGLAIQRFVPANLLRPLDRFIHPICLLLIIGTGTVDAYILWTVRSLVIWQDFLSSVLTPCFGIVAATVAMLAFKENLAKTKSVCIAASIQNTAISMFLLHYNYPSNGGQVEQQTTSRQNTSFYTHSVTDPQTTGSPDVTLMYVTLAIFDMTITSLVLITYILHVIVWSSRPDYRTLHDRQAITGTASARSGGNSGNGFYRQVAQRLVRSMIKAGEITFRRQHQGPNAEGGQGPGRKPVEGGTAEAITLSVSASPVSSTTSSPHDDKALGRGGGTSPGQGQHGFCNSSFGNKVLVVSCDSIVRSHHASSSSAAVAANTPPTAGRLSVASGGPGAEGGRNYFDVSMMYNSGHGTAEHTAKWDDSYRAGARKGAVSPPRSTTPTKAAHARGGKLNSPTHHHHRSKAYDLFRATNSPSRELKSPSLCDVHSLSQNEHGFNFSPSQKGGQATMSDAGKTTSTAAAEETRSLSIDYEMLGGLNSGNNCYQQQQQQLLLNQLQTAAGAGCEVLGRSYSVDRGDQLSPHSRDGLSSESTSRDMQIDTKPRLTIFDHLLAPLRSDRIE